MLQVNLFHIEIKQAYTGHLIFITDEQGNPIRYPIKMSDFKERPKFYESEMKVLDSNLIAVKANHEQYKAIENMDLTRGALKSLIFRELIRQTNVNISEGSGLQKKRYMLKARMKKNGKRF